jgi:hypothetical protein
LKKIFFEFFEIKKKYLNLYYHDFEFEFEFDNFFNLKKVAKIKNEKMNCNLF